MENDKLYMGIIFTTGLFSFFGFDELKTYSRRKNDLTSESYLGRLLNTEMSGSEETRIDFTKYGDFNYYNAPFYINKETIIEWIDLCVKCKVTYAIIVAKHHDEFCLWNTNYSIHKSKNDIVLLFKNECEKRGILFGIYYSWMNFQSGMNYENFMNIYLPQIYELLSYNPRYIFFDCDYVIKQKKIKAELFNLISYIKSNNIYINSRITKEIEHLSSFFDFGYRNFPNFYSTRWVHVNSIGLSWGYNKFQQKGNYKNGRELLNLYNQTVNLGGSFLLNIGPKFNGELDENEKKSIKEFCELI